MKTKMLIALCMLILLSYTALADITGTIKDVKVILRIYEEPKGQITGTIRVKNDNNYTIKVDSTSSDPKMTFKANNATLQPEEEYGFNYSIDIITPINMSFLPVFTFIGNGESIPMTAQVAIISYFTTNKSEPNNITLPAVVVPTVTPNESGGGTGGSGGSIASPIQKNTTKPINTTQSPVQNVTAKANESEQNVTVIEEPQGELTVSFRAPPVKSKFPPWLGAVIPIVLALLVLLVMYLQSAKKDKEDEEKRKKEQYETISKDTNMGRQGMV
jgi:hypothetical protein